MKTQFDISEIKTPVNAKYVELTLPEESSDDLAYVCGVLAGDGHISSIEHKKKRYVIECAGNPKDEKEFYLEVVCPLFKQLFNINLVPRQHQTTFGIRFGSVKLVKYLTNVLGLPKNNKYNQLKIPHWIRLDKDLIISYIRGLSDTDFCLTLKKRYKNKHYYPVITGASKSQSYMEEIITELEKLGLRVCRSYNIVQLDDRFKSGFNVIHRMHIYGATEMIKWMNIIGFRSPKHLKKFEIWKSRNANSNISKVKKALEDSKLISGAGITSPG